MDIDAHLVAEKELQGVKRKRSQPYIFEKFEYELVEKRHEEGWIVDKELKNLVRMKKLKPIDERFEDEVWILFAMLGFKTMNRDRYLKIPYDDSCQELSKQIDVFAVDDETILFIECKCSPKGKKGIFKSDIEAINGIKHKLFASVRKMFPDRKAKYIFITKNYDITDVDRSRMKEFGIQYLDEYSINYYRELVKHLGSSARYQLLGQLFEGQKIAGMDNLIPAISGDMGRQKYYSFTIEPEKLLKIAYIPHKDESINRDISPTYQRIIKKNRLKEVQSFVNKGGFFPNSLIISIDTKGKKLLFDLSSLQVKDSISKIGILHLPQIYRTAYIIDGQHRLYGYADSRYEGKNTIPVVAFVDLDRKKQVELFMQINENQKAVPKDIRNTLLSDILWNSPSLKEQRKSMRLTITNYLGESNVSPFYRRIILGENEKTSIRCLGTETFDKSLESTNFFNKYNAKNHIIKNGIFEKGERETTCKLIQDYLIGCFNYISTQVPIEWEKGEDNQGVLSINNSIYGLIRIISDIITYLSENGINPINESVDILVKRTIPFLDPLVIFFNSITDEQRQEIKTNYGSGGKPRIWRMFQKVISDKIEDFEPDGLEQWIKDNTKKFNTESFRLIQDIQHLIKKDFFLKLESKYGKEWIKGIPSQIAKQANSIMGDTNIDNELNDISEVVTLWDCITLEHCKDIAIWGPNWSDLFEKSYTLPMDKHIKGGKSAKIQWMNKLAKISTKNRATYSITEEEYNFLISIYDFLFQK